MVLLLEEVAYSIRARMRHSPECPWPGGHRSCVCAVERSARYVEKYASKLSIIEGCALCGSVFPEHRCHGAGPVK